MTRRWLDVLYGFVLGVALMVGVIQAALRELAQHAPCPPPANVLRVAAPGGVDSAHAAE